MKKHLWKAFTTYPVLFLTVIASYASPGDPKPAGNSLPVKKVAATNDTLAIVAGMSRIVIEEPAIKLNSSIEKFVADYVKKNDEMLEGIKSNHTSSFSTIEKVFEKQGLPVELKYLAVVESKLKNAATSKVGAAGIWQLMPKTARLLGLRVAGKTDERRYTYKSSLAAAKYLDDLFELYDDWLLVIAAYNSGPGYVNKAIKRSGSRDFWKLQYFLPKETRLHVKKFIATHYYYEEKGSLVTLTKKERENHLQAVKEFEESLQDENQPVEENNDTTQTFFNWIVIMQDEFAKLKAIARK